MSPPAVLGSTEWLCLCCDESHISYFNAFNPLIFVLWCQNTRWPVNYWAMLVFIGYIRFVGYVFLTQAVFTMSWYFSPLQVDPLGRPHPILHPQCHSSSVRASTRVQLLPSRRHTESQPVHSPRNRHRLSLLPAYLRTSSKAHLLRSLSPPICTGPHPPLHRLLLLRTQREHFRAGRYQ